MRIFSQAKTKMLCMISLLVLLSQVVFPPAHAQQSDAGDKANEFWRAARLGDAARVKALLAAGVDVNTKFRYGATALSYACDRGHIEVVRVLLEHGADINVKDTFYNATPLSWAVFKGHAEVVRLLLKKGATGDDDFFRNVAAQGNVALVRAFLEHAELKPESLSAALAAAERNQHTEILALLAAAGAKPLELAVKIDPAELVRFAGKYRSERGHELSFQVQDGQLHGGPAGQRPMLLVPLDKNMFQPAEIPGLRLAFQIEGQRITSLIVKQGENETFYRRVKE